MIGIAAPRFFFIADAGEAVSDPVAAPTLGRSLRVVVVWGALWAAPVVIVGVVFGWDSLYAGLGGFFSQMAVVTFGGAYAVLAYVGQVAVSSYHWLMPGQMLDGLALAETTPGPLLLVLTFVGFIAAHSAPGVLPPLAGGFLGALLVTWVTFVPSFLWILLGAPYIERVRGNRTIAAGLAAITAAVVGVILNLAVFLALHVLFGQVGEVSWSFFRPAWPVFSSLDPEALALSVIAAVALFRLRLGILPVLAVCGVLGLLIRLI